MGNESSASQPNGNPSWPIEIFMPAGFGLELLCARALCVWSQLSRTVDPNRTARIRIQWNKEIAVRVVESWSNENLSVFYLYSSLLMWRDTTYAVSRCPHRFVILNPSSCSLGMFSPDSFNMLLTSLSDGIIRQSVYRPSLCPVCITSPYTLTMLLLLLFAFFGSKDFLKKAHFWSWCISYFCGWFCLFFFAFYFVIYIFFNLWVEGVFFSTVLKQHSGKCHGSSVSKKDTHKRNVERSQQSGEFWPANKTNPQFSPH